MSDPLKPFRLFRYVVGVSFVFIVANLFISFFSDSVLPNLFFLKFGCLSILITVILFLFPKHWLYDEIGWFGSSCAETSVKSLMKKMDKDSSYYSSKSDSFECEWEYGEMFENYPKDDIKHKEYRKDQYISGDYFVPDEYFNHYITETNNYSNNYIIYKLRLFLFAGIVMGWFLAVKFWENDFWLKLAISIADIKR